MCPLFQAKAEPVHTSLFTPANYLFCVAHPDNFLLFALFIEYVYIYVCISAQIQISEFIPLVVQN